MMGGTGGVGVGLRRTGVAYANEVTASSYAAPGTPESRFTSAYLCILRGFIPGPAVCLD